MLLSPRRASTAADLARVIAAWLALVVLVQALAASQALWRWHRHADAAVTIGTPAPTTNRAATSAHRHHAHDGVERHHHAMPDANVEPVAAVDPAQDAATLALALAFGLFAVVALMGSRTARGRAVWHAALPWALVCADARLRKRPPRHG